MDEQELKLLGCTYATLSVDQRTKLLNELSLGEKVILNKWNLLCYIKDRKDNEEDIKYLIKTTEDIGVLQEAFITYVLQQNENK